MADLYDIVGDKIIEFCNKTYYSDIVVSFEQSYDDVNWTKEVELAYFNGTELWYLNDWNEGQKYIRNLRIWHLEDSEPIKRGKWIKLYHDNYKCSECGSWWGSDYNDEVINDFHYCPNCGARMTGEVK